MHRLLWIALLGACTPEDGSGLNPVVLDHPASHNPIAPVHPALPFPSDLYLASGASTETGRRIDLPADAVPPRLTAEMFANHDGFTRVPAMVTAFGEPLDPSTLPVGPAASIEPGASVQVVELGGDPVPVLVEVDATVDVPTKQSLLIRPVQALDPATTYAVVVRNAVKAEDGSDLDRSPATQALIDGRRTDHDLLEDNREDLLAAIDQVGSSDLLQLWTFTTRSKEQVTGPAIAIQDAMASASLESLQLEQPEIQQDRILIRGVIDVPNFLTAENALSRNADGHLAQDGVREIPILLTVPTSHTGQSAGMVFGHGFFSSMEETTWSSLFRGLEAWDMAAISTNFSGFDEASTGTSFAILGGGLDQLPTVINQQLQSQGHFTILDRLLTEELPRVLVEDFDMDLLDGSSQYLGISNGGTQGLVILTTSPTLSRGALVVPGGGWTHMIQRATQWNTLGSLLSTTITDPIDLQVALSLLQNVFDPVDSINFVEHLYNDRLPGRPENPELLIVEAVGDCQVANEVTEWVARTAGVPVLEPSVRSPWGIPTATEADNPSAAYIMFDEGYPVLPTGNVAPEEDNGAHETIRKLDSYTDLMDTFLHTGAIVHPCDGPCDPE